MTDKNDLAYWFPINVPATIEWPGPVAYAATLDYAKLGELTLVDEPKNLTRRWLWLNRQRIGLLVSLRPEIEVHQKAVAGRWVRMSSVVKTTIDLVLSIPTPDPEPEPENAIFGGEERT